MITVIGAGNGGLAMSYYLHTKGIETCSWNRSTDRTTTIITANNTIEVFDYVAGLNVKIPINIVPDIKNAVTKSKLLIIITPGTAHRDIAHRIAEYITPEHAIILMPGRTYGSMEFIDIIYELKGFRPVCYETQTILHTCRSEGNRVHIFAQKPKVFFSGYRVKSDSVNRILSDIFPELIYIEDYFQVTLNNIGAMLHPTITVLNTGRVDAGTSFKFYHEGLTPIIAEYLENLDCERKLVCASVGCEFISLQEWIAEEYGPQDTSIYKGIQSVGAYKDILGPQTLNHRYIYDDVSTGLVPIYYTGKAFGIEMSYTEALIQFISKVTKYDFFKNGRKFDLRFSL